MILKSRKVSTSLIGKPELYTSQIYQNLKIDINTLLNNPDGSLTKLKQFYTVLGVADLILAVSGKYYIVSNNKLELVQQSNNPLNFIDTTIIDGKIKISINKPNFEYLLINKVMLGLTETEKHYIGNLFLRSLQELITSNNINTYLNYEVQELDNRLNSFEGPTCQIDTNYNYYCKEFEEAFLKNKEYQYYYSSYYRIEDYLNDPNISFISKETLRDRQYFINKGLTLQNDIASGSAYNINNQIYNINSIPNTINESIFPYNNLIQFTNLQQNESFNQFINQNNLSTFMLSNLFKTFYSSSNLENLVTETNTVIEEKVSNGKYKNIYGDFVDLKFNSNIETTSIDNSLFSNIFSYITSSLNNPYFYYNTSSIPNLEIIPSLDISNTKGISTVFTYIKGQQILVDLFSYWNNYETVIGLNPLPTNTIAYQIEKYCSGSSPQRNMIPKLVSGEADNTYIDTQVIYDTDYEYNIFSYDVIPKLTTEYSASEVVSEAFSVTPITSMVPVVYKNKIYKKIVKINDDPPLPPSVNFITYKNVSNKITLDFNTMFGELVDKPIILNETDQISFENIYKLQGRTDSKIKFKTTDPLKEVHMFVTNVKPSSYNDYSIIDPVVINMNSSYTKTISLQVTPNLKYYFIFRSVDVHGLVSNPTCIYELEIISNNGAIYSVLNEVNFDINKNYDTSKSFKKYLCIQPAVEYGFVMPNEDGTATLGAKQELWSQKYKARITSKKSGKSFDINFSYVKSEKDLT